MTDRSPITISREKAIPRATYRLQLHAAFGFDAAAAVVPYLAQLGVSHVYTSPILQAATGSMHGYDVVDHTRINSELGGDAGFERLIAAVRSAGMGLVVDVVPNHMAIGEENAWWWDLLRHGRASRHAATFDIDWEPPEPRLRGVILLPVLADHYGRVLETGRIRLARRGTEIEVTVDRQRFPLDPRTMEPMVADGAERADSQELRALAASLGALPPSTATDDVAVARRRSEWERLDRRLAELLARPDLAEAVDAAIGAMNADPDRLDALLEGQNYRLAFWRAASRDLGYRRFFDIDTLVGLRVEDPTVFAATHRVILERVADGQISGLRIDHPDGLRDPGAYFERLREAAPHAWIVAEKILGADEELPPWPIDGTTGYRFANQATGLLVDTSGEAALTATYHHAARTELDWDEVATASRRLALTELLGSDLNRLADLLVRVCETNRRYRDYTRHELHEALREMAAAIPVYRTYLRPGAATRKEDRAVVEGAAELAARRRPDLDRSLLDFLRGVLLLQVDDDRAAELAIRFQQLTPAAMAKGVEDTAFYRYLRLVALNEVGGDPGRFGLSPVGFHAAMQSKQARWPHAMLALSTHDTKRSADVRARLVLLSEDPDGWSAAVDALARHAAPHRNDTMPGAPAEYLFYQTLVGAWPIDAERVAAYLVKAAREAKERTNWTDPDAEYEDELTRMVRHCLADPAFVSEVERVVEPLVEAGRANALGQALVHLASPGVPDLYQGSELWDLSLVDPDNRRPVDYDRRRELLDRMAGLAPAEVMRDAGNGLPKLWVVARALALRARRPASFGESGGYEPLEARGPAAEHVVAFVRGGDVVAVAPRLPLALKVSGGWRGTQLDVPAGRWRNVLADTEVSGPRLDVAGLLALFPVALLERIT